MEKNNKSLLITLEYPPIIGGVARYYKNLVDFLGVDKIEVKTDGLLDAGWPKWLPAIKQTFGLLRQRNFSYLLIGQVLPLGYVGLLAKIFFHQKYIVFTHGLDIKLPQNNWWKKKWLIRILKQADKIIANSLFTKKELLKLSIPENKIETIYPCVNLIPLEKLLVRKNNTILSVGRLVERKGFDLVLKSLPLILKDKPDIRYVIVGQGPDEKRLKKIVQDLNLEKQVTFLGLIDDEEKIEWYKKADVFAMPCRCIKQDIEGFGTVFLEAGNYALPLVVGDSGGARETIINGQTGWLINPESVEDLAEVLKKIFFNPAQAKEMGEEGRRLIEKKFTCSIQWSNFKKIIES